MAVINKNGGYNALPIAYKRGNPIALDTTSVWYSMSDLESYAASGATAYVGQIVTFVDEINSTAEAYMIADAEGTLVKLAQTTASGNLASDVVALQTAIGHPASAAVGTPGQDGYKPAVEATGIFARIEAAEDVNEFVGTASLNHRDEVDTSSTTLAGFVNYLAFGTGEGTLGLAFNEINENTADIEEMQELHAYTDTEVPVEGGEPGETETVRTYHTVAEEIDSSINEGTGNNKHSKFAGYAYEAKVTSLEGLHADKTGGGKQTVAEEVAAGIATVVNGANESFDTLKEIADWIANDTSGAASMANDISALKTTVGTNTEGLVKKVSDLEAKTAGDFTVGTGSSATTDIKHYVDNKVDNVSSTLGDLAVKDTVTENDLGTNLATKINSKADKVSSATNGNFAGLDANGNLTDSGKKAADFATATQGGKADSAIQGVKVNGTALTATDNVVNVTVATGSTNGTIAVNGSDVAVKGLGTAAYKADSAFDAAGSAVAVLGTATDAATATTVYGVKAAAAAAQSKADTNEAAIAILNGDSASAGSVAKAIKDAKTAVLGKVGGVGADKDNDFNGTVKSVHDEVVSAKGEVIGANTDTKTANTIYGAKAYADDAVSTAVAGLDAVVSISDDGNTNPLNISITEVDGKLTAVTGSIDANTFDAYGAAATVEGKLKTVATSGKAEDVTIADTNNRISATTVEGALDEIANKVNTLTGDNSVTGSVAKSVKDAIDALDVSDSAETGKFVTVVSEADGKISVTRAALVASDIPELAQSKITGLETALAGKQASITDGSATIASVSDGVVTIKAGVAQSSGAVAQGSGNDIVLAKAAKTGAAVDISISDSGNLITATTVEGAITEIAGEVDANTAAIVVLNGNASTTGSVAKAIADIVGTSSDAASVDTIKGAKAYAASLVADGSAIDGRIDTLEGKISGVFHYKGNATKNGNKLYVNSEEITSPEVGDVYCVSDEEYAWNGTAWYLLGVTTDLSNYYNKSQIDSKIGGISGALTFKGVLLNNQFGANGLPNITGMENGDVWLNGSGEQFAYNGTTWVKLGYLTDLSAYSTTSQVQNMIDGAIAGLYAFKGSVANVNALNDIVGPATGDVYVVGTGSSQKQYAWDGDEWVEVTTNVDLSDYAKTSDINTAIASAKSEAITTAAADADVEREVAKAYADDLSNALKGSGWTSDMTLVSADSRLDALEATVDTANTGLSAQVTAINTAIGASSNPADGTIRKRLNTLEAAPSASVTTEKITAWDGAVTDIATLNGDVSTTGSVAKSIKDAIDAIDVTDTAESGKYVSAVSQTNGVISVSRVALPTATASALGLVKVDNTSIEVSDAGAISVKAVDVQKLYIAEGDELILNGGNA